MKWRDPAETSKATTDRVLALIYGPTGVGKTVSTLKSLPRPLLYIECEPKGVERTGKGNIDWEGIKIGRPDSYEDLRMFLADEEEKIIEGYRSMFIDGLSFFMNIELLGAIQEETGKADVFESKDRPLVNAGRTDKAGYGALAALMNRLCKLIGNIAAGGVVTVITALQKDDPTWNRELAAGPSLAGKKFADDMPGFFDLIGKVERKTNKEGTADGAQENQTQRKR